MWYQLFTANSSTAFLKKCHGEFGTHDQGTDCKYRNMSFKSYQLETEVVKFILKKNNKTKQYQQEAA